MNKNRSIAFVVNTFAKAEDASLADDRFWKNTSPAERLAEAFSLMQLQPHDPGQRHVEAVMVKLDRNGKKKD